MPDRSAQKPLPPFVLWMFASLYGFSDGLAWYFTPVNIWNGEQMPSMFRPKEELLLLCSPEFLLHRDRVAKKVFSSVLSPALGFITRLRQAMVALARDPILVAT